jgi:protein-S-isoprenylcysteine O-methyltransferase Ste14
MSASAQGRFFMRWRVRLGYPLALVVLWFSRPTLRSILFGGLTGVLGLWLRGYAAGYLRKHEILTVTGPYAHTRNPLYLGSAILAVSGAIATRSWLSASIIAAYFAIFYSLVMGREEEELGTRYGGAFAEYAREVPLFLPRVQAAKLSGESAGVFSFAQYKKNREWQAPLGFLLLLAVLLLISYFRPR